MAVVEFVRATTPGVCDRCDRVYLTGTVLLTDPLGLRCSCAAEPESQRAAVSRPSRAVAVA